MKRNIKNIVKIALFLVSSIIGINAQQKQEVKISTKEKVLVGATGIAIAGLVAANINTGIYTNFLANFAYLGGVMIVSKLAASIPNLPSEVQNAIMAVDWGSWILPFGAILGNHLKSWDLLENPHAITYILAGCGVKLSEQAAIMIYGVAKTIYKNNQHEEKNSTDSLDHGISRREIRRS